MSEWAPSARRVQRERRRAGREGAGVDAALRRVDGAGRRPGEPAEVAVVDAAGCCVSVTVGAVGSASTANLRAARFQPPALPAVTAKTCEPTDSAETARGEVHAAHGAPSSEQRTLAAGAGDGERERGRRRVAGRRRAAGDRHDRRGGRRRRDGETDVGAGRPAACVARGDRDDVRAAREAPDDAGRGAGAQGAPSSEQTWRSTDPRAAHSITTVVAGVVAGGADRSSIDGGAAGTARPRTMTCAAVAVAGRAPVDDHRVAVARRRGAGTGSVSRTIGRPGRAITMRAPSTLATCPTTSPGDAPRTRRDPSGARTGAGRAARRVASTSTTTGCPGFSHETSRPPEPTAMFPPRAGAGRRHRRRSR